MHLLQEFTLTELSSMSFCFLFQVSVILEVVPVNEFFPAFIRAPYVINVKEVRYFVLSSPIQLTNSV